MITDQVIEDNKGREWYVVVCTDDGGDQSYGPFFSLDTAESSLRSIIENDFELPFEPDRTRYLRLKDEG